MKTTELKTETRKEYQKSQLIRLADVFVIGPVMIYAGTFTALPTWLRISMVGFGIATVVYNGKNYIKNKLINY